MKTISNRKEAIRFGIRSGVLLGCLYATILAAIWVTSADLAKVSLPQRIFAFVWFLLYGLPIGSIVGAIAGLVNGYVLYEILWRFHHYFKGQAWVIGLVTATGLWLLMHLTLGRLLPAADTSATTSLADLFVNYPGLIHLLAAPLLAQYFYRTYFRSTNQQGE